MRQKLARSFIVVFLLSMCFAAPAFAWGPKQWISDFEDYIDTNIQTSQEDMINALVDNVMQLDNGDTISQVATYYLFNILSANLGYYLIAIFFGLRLFVNLSNPFVSGRLHFDQEESIFLKVMGALLFSYLARDLVNWLLEVSNVFMTWSNSTSIPIHYGSDFEIGWMLIYFFFVFILDVIWALLSALYQFREFMISLLFAAFPFVGASIVFTETFVKRWISLLIMFIFMKPIHNFAIHFYFDFIADKSDGQDWAGVILGIFYFGFILVLPIWVFGGQIRNIVVQARTGGI